MNWFSADSLEIVLKSDDLEVVSDGLVKFSGYGNNGNCELVVLE